MLYSIFVCLTVFWKPLNKFDFLCTKIFSSLLSMLIKWHVDNSNSISNNAVRDHPFHNFWHLPHSLRMFFIVPYANYPHLFFGRQCNFLLNNSSFSYFRVFFQILCLIFCCIETFYTCFPYLFFRQFTTFFIWYNSFP